MILLQALAQSPATDASLDVVGDGPDRATRSRAGRRARASPGAYRGTGALPQPQLAAVLPGGARWSCPATNEGLGLVAVEALLCETPVVAFGLGGIPDVVSDGETGRARSDRRIRARWPTAIDADRSRETAASRARGLPGARASGSRFEPAPCAAPLPTIYEKRDRAARYSTGVRGCAQVALLVRSSWLVVRGRWRATGRAPSRAGAATTLPDWRSPACRRSSCSRAMRVLIETWRRVVMAWGGASRSARAARIWFVSNLGTYVPGKVWQITAMGAMAQRGRRVARRRRRVVAARAPW